MNMQTKVSVTKMLGARKTGEMLNVPEKGRVQIMEDIGQIIRFQFHYE